jgi:transcriptional regulator with XRE-family HTH domain
MIGHNVRGFRNRLGVSQEKLAELASVDRAYMGCVERAEKSVSAEVLYRIGEALKIKPHLLLIEEAYKLTEKELEKKLLP